MSFSLIETAKMVKIDGPKDKTGAALATEWISLKNARDITFVIETGVMTSTSNQAVQLYVADDASGTHNVALGASADLTMDAYWSRAASTDTYTKTTVASSTFNLTKSSDNKTFVIPIQAAKAGNFVKSSVTYAADYIRLAVASPGAHACLMHAFAILSGLRYQEDSPPTALT